MVVERGDLVSHLKNARSPADILAVAFEYAAGHEADFNNANPVLSRRRRGKSSSSLEWEDRFGGVLAPSGETSKNLTAAEAERCAIILDEASDRDFTSAVIGLIRAAQVALPAYL